jgi:hypothetical protein
MQRIFINRLLAIPVIGAAIILLSITGCKKQSEKPIGLAELTTNAPTDITAISAACGGLVSSEGGEHTWVRGICWDTKPNPTVNSSVNYNGVSGTGTFSFLMVGLMPLTKYYVRAYAQNSGGTAYGNEFSFSTSALVIGGRALDGIVFDIDSTGLHGLLCARADQGEVSWSNGNYVATNAFDTENGYENTSLIINAEGITGAYAALICEFYVSLYSDAYVPIWYLPSKDELNKLYNEKSVIAGFSEGDYWSSTEFNTNNAWLKNFSDGKETASDKAIAHNVRAVRKF